MYSSGYLRAQIPHTRVLLFECTIILFPKLDTLSPFYYTLPSHQKSHPLVYFCLSVRFNSLRFKLHWHPTKHTMYCQTWRNYMNILKIIVFFVHINMLQDGHYVLLNNSMYDKKIRLANILPERFCKIKRTSLISKLFKTYAE